MNNFLSKLLELFLDPTQLLKRSARQCGRAMPRLWLVSFYLSVETVWGHGAMPLDHKDLSLCCFGVWLFVFLLSIMSQQKVRRPALVRLALLRYEPPSRNGQGMSLLAPTCAGGACQWYNQGRSSFSCVCFVWLIFGSFQKHQEKALYFFCMKPFLSRNQKYPCFCCPKK